MFLYFLDIQNQQRMDYQQLRPFPFSKYDMKNFTTNKNLSISQFSNRKDLHQQRKFFKKIYPVKRIKYQNEIGETQYLDLLPRHTKPTKGIKLLYPKVSVFIV